MCYFDINISYTIYWEFFNWAWITHMRRRPLNSICYLMFLNSKELGKGDDVTVCDKWVSDKYGLTRPNKCAYVMFRLMFIQT